MMSSLLTSSPVDLQVADAVAGLLLIWLKLIFSDSEVAGNNAIRPHALARAGIVRPGRLVSHGHAAAADALHARRSLSHLQGVRSILKPERTR
jgi:hypothetical protein